MPAEIEEEKIREKTPSATVKKIALLKSKEISHKIKIVFNYSAIACHLKTNNRQLEETIIISADTMVYIPKSKLKNQKAKFIGKPETKNEAKQILTTLSGSTHWLYSGICVLQIRQIGQIRPTCRRGRQIRTFLDYDKSKVTFRKLTEKEIDEYVKNNPVTLWAGAYTIEKGTAGAGFIKKIKGSNSNVLGLPVKKLKKILSQIGLI